MFRPTVTEVRIVLKDAQNAWKWLVTQHLIVELFIAGVEHDFYDLKKRFCFLNLLILFDFFENVEKSWKKVSFCEEYWCNTFVSLFLWDILKFLQHLTNICDSRIRYFVLEIKINSICCWHRYRIFSLIVLNELPKSICAERFFETQRHNFILSNLSPLNSILGPFELNVRVYYNIVEQFSRWNCIVPQPKKTIFTLKFRVTFAFLHPGLIPVNSLQTVQSASQCFCTLSH